VPQPAGPLPLWHRRASNEAGHESSAREVSNPHERLGARLIAPRTSLRCASMRRKIALNGPVM